MKSLRHPFLPLVFAPALALPGHARDAPAPLVVEGYRGKASYAPGDARTLHVSTGAGAFSSAITRIGAASVSVWKQDSPPGAAHAIPEDASSNGCGWPALRGTECVDSELHGRCGMFIVTLIDTTDNSILHEWPDLWPGGLCQRDESVLNLMVQCRGGGLGYNRAECDHCGGKRWFPGSCGRLPDCPHFHVVFTLPEELRGFFESNYRVAAGAFLAAAAETLESFMRNNSNMGGGFLVVLHTSDPPCGRRNQ